MKTIQKHFPTDSLIECMKIDYNRHRGQKQYTEVRAGLCNIFLALFKNTEKMSFLTKPKLVRSLKNLENYQKKKSKFFKKQPALLRNIRSYISNFLEKKLLEV